MTLTSNGETAGSITSQGVLIASGFKADGLPGATASTRYAGGTSAGAPVTGTFRQGDWVIDQAPAIWICTAAGSPGTWSAIRSAVFNAADFGATGNGTTDDAASIQAAMNAAGPTGGTVVLAPGTYLINSPLVWQPPAGGLTNQAFYAPSLTGAGPGASQPRWGNYKQASTLIVAGPSFPAGQFMIDYLGDTGANNCIAGYQVGGFSLACGTTAAGIRNFNAHTSWFHDITINEPAIPAPAYNPVAVTAGFSTIASPSANAYNNHYSRIEVYDAQKDGLSFNEGNGSLAFASECLAFNSVRYNYQMGDGTSASNCGSQSAGTAEFLVNNAILTGCFVDGPTGTTSGNAVVITTGSNRTARLNGCTFYGSSVSGTEAATAMVNCGAGVANVIFDGCTFITSSHTSDWVYTTSGATGNMHFRGCFFTTLGGSALTVQPYNFNGAAISVTFSQCPGLNPFGTQTVAVPATTVATAALPFDATYYVTAGSSGTTTMAISGGPTITIPASACVPVRVPAGKTLTPTYTSAPTWVVEGE